MISLGSAIGTGLFLGSGLAIQTAGPSVLVSYAIGAFIVLLLMGCLAEMTVAHPTSGSFGTIAERVTFWTAPKPASRPPSAYSRGTGTSSEANEQAARAPAQSTRASWTSSRTRVKGFVCVTGRFNQLAITKNMILG